MIIETVIPNIALSVDKYILKATSGIIENKFNAPITINNPTAPPIKQRIIASIRNSKRMTYFFAPSAFLIPIIFVRSLTETNIIFATLNIPTNKAKPPIIPPTKYIIPKKPSNRLLNIVNLFKAKLLSSFGFNLRLDRNNPVISSSKSSKLTPSFALTAKFVFPLFLSTLANFLAKLYEIKTTSSNCITCNKSSPPFSITPITSNLIPLIEIFFPIGSRFPKSSFATVFPRTTLFAPVEYSDGV